MKLSGPPSAPLAFNAGQRLKPWSGTRLNAKKLKKMHKTQHKTLDLIGPEHIGVAAEYRDENESRR